MDQQRTALRFPLIEVDDDLEGRLRPGVAADALHIVRECLSNAARHATAQTVELSLHVVDTNLRLVVADDGIGFDPQATRSGHGLTNIEERASIHGGTVVVDATPGRGTTILVTLPDVLDDL